MEMVRFVRQVRYVRSACIKFAEWKPGFTRTIEHQQDSMAGKWEASGATEHTKKCHGMFNWLHTKTLSIQPCYRDRKIRESLETNFAKTQAEFDSQLTIVNRDNGIKDVSSTSWKPLFHKISEYKGKRSLEPSNPTYFRNKTAW